MIRTLFIVGITTTTTTGVNSRASSVPQWQTPSSRTPACFPGTTGLLGCWLDCWGLAHPVKTERTRMNGGGSRSENSQLLIKYKQTVTAVSICIFFFFAASNLISRLMREHDKLVGKSLQYVFHPVGAITPCTWLLPVLKLELKRHHRLDSNDSEEYLSICCHLHTLQTRIHHIELSVGGRNRILCIFLNSLEQLW